MALKHKGVENMKLLMERYRTISIWLSLVILALAFVIGSDKSWYPVGVPLVFLVGFLMYLLGGIREWKRGKTTAFLIEALLAVIALAAAVQSLFRLGGIL